jgi:hypothetical protein
MGEKAFMSNLFGKKTKTLFLQKLSYFLGFAAMEPWGIGAVPKELHDSQNYEQILFEMASEVRGGVASFPGGDLDLMCIL